MLSNNNLNNVNIVKLTHAYQDAQQRMEHVSNLATLWLRSMIFLGGGSIVSLFTLLGNVKGLTINHYGLWIAFASMAASLCATMLATLFWFLSQDHYRTADYQWAENIYKDVTGRDDHFDLNVADQAGDRWYIPALIAAASALVLFIVGSTAALVAVRP